MSDKLPLADGWENFEAEEIDGILITKKFGLPEGPWYQDLIGEMVIPVQVQGMHKRTFFGKGQKRSARVTFKAIGPPEFRPVMT